MKKLIAFLPFLLITSCATAEVEAELCKSSEIAYTDLGFFKNKGLVHGKVTREIDVSSQLKKINEYGTVSAFVSKSRIESLDSSLDWAGSIIVDLISSDGTITRISDTTIDVNQMNIDLNVNGSIDIAKHLQSGKAQLLYTLGGTLPTSFKINNTICFDIKAEASKDL